MIEVTNEQLNAQPLLLEYNTIILPDTIDHDAYVEFAWSMALAQQLREDDNPILIYCAGWGGHASYGFAIADLIRLDGNVDSVALGQCHSAHSIIWASCNNRFVTPHGGIGIHQARNSYAESKRLNTQDLELGRQQTKQFNDFMAAMFNEISDDKYNLKYWNNQLWRGNDDTLILGYEELIKHGMARPFSERGVSNESR